MKMFKKSILIMSLLFAASATSALADDEQEHKKAHQEMESKMLSDWKSTMSVVTTSSDDFLDMGDKMIKEGVKTKDPGKMQKGAELLKMGVMMSKQVIDFDHEYLAKEIPHEVMHKNHMRIKTKVSGLISDRSRDFINMGGELVKTGKAKNDGEMLMNGGKLLNLGMEIQMMNQPEKK